MWAAPEHCVPHPWSRSGSWSTEPHSRHGGTCRGPTTEETPPERPLLRRHPTTEAHLEVVALTACLRHLEHARDTRRLQRTELRHELLSSFIIIDFYQNQSHAYMVSLRL